jgi:hypothetical protein
MRKATSRFALVLAAAALWTGSLAAQSTTAGITGTITDASGATVVGTSITVANDATGLTRQTKSGDSGNYSRRSARSWTRARS